MQTQPVTLPKIAAVVTHEVKDYAAWKSVYDADVGARKAHGIFTTHINRDASDPNLLTVYLGASQPDGLESFLSSPELKEKMRTAGVEGPPRIALVTPVEDHTVKNRGLPAIIVRHEVADYDAWKKGFDAHADARARGGIVGYAVNRSLDNPNLVVVYLQAGSLDQLHAFASSADLKQAMQKAGVKGAPQIAFVQGQGWEN